MTSDPNTLRTPMSRARGLGTTRSGTGDFWRQRLTGVANVPLTLSFVVIVLMLAKRDYAGAIALVGHPLAAILLLLFIGSATIHMRLGMQVIIEDYVHAEATKIALLMLNTFFAVFVGLASAYAILKIGFSA